MSFIKYLGLSLGCAFILTGCVTPVQYTCKDIESDTDCTSLTDTANMTAYNLPKTLPSRGDVKGNKPGQPLYEPIYNTKRLNYVDAGEPVLTQPWVSSILFTPYVTSQGDLDTGGYLYMKVSESQWVLEK